MVGLSRLYTTRQNVVVNSHSVIGCHVRNIGSYIYYIVGIYMSSDIYYYCCNKGEITSDADVR